MGIKIVKVKVVGLCSKHRKEGDEIPRYANGQIVEDEDISCLEEAFNENIQSQSQLSNREQIGEKDRREIAKVDSPSNIISVSADCNIQKSNLKIANELWRWIDLQIQYPELYRRLNSKERDLIMQQHLSDCQRFLEFLKDDREYCARCGETNYMDKMIKDLKSTIKFYASKGITA